MVQVTFFTLISICSIDMQATRNMLQEMLDHVLNSGLSAVTGNDVCFKVGITYWPDRRFEMQDYRKLQLMIVALISEDCDWTAAQERAAIAR